MWIEVSVEEATLIRDALENYSGLNSGADKNLDNVFNDIITQIDKTLEGETADEAIDSWSVVMTTESGKRIEFFDSPDGASGRIDEAIEEQYKVLWG